MGMLSKDDHQLLNEGSMDDKWDGGSDFVDVPQLVRLLRHLRLDHQGPRVCLRILHFQETAAERLDEEGFWVFWIPHEPALLLVLLVVDEMQVDSVLVGGFGNCHAQLSTDQVTSSVVAFDDPELLVLGVGIPVDDDHFVLVGRVGVIRFPSGQHHLLVEVSHDFV